MITSDNAFSSIGSENVFGSLPVPQVAHRGLGAMQLSCEFFKSRGENLTKIRGEVTSFKFGLSASASTSFGLSGDQLAMRMARSAKLSS